MTCFVSNPLSQLQKKKTINCTMERSWFKHRIIAIYAIISLLIFEQVYETSKEVIDELFHIEQGLHYCYGMFMEVIFSAFIKFSNLIKFIFSGIQKLQLYQAYIYSQSSSRAVILTFYVSFHLHAQ